MGPKLFTAVRLYIDGVRDGHLEAALDKYVADDMIQLSPGIEAGRAGLARHWEPIVNAYDRRLIRPMRGFEDGSTVVLHTFQSFGLRQLEQVSIDIFDTDLDDHIVEHRNVTTPLRPCSRIGLSQIDGPACIPDPTAGLVATRVRTEASKAVVREYVDDVLIGGNIDHLSTYVSADGFAQHDPDGMRLRYADVDVLVGSGDFVATTGMCASGSGTYAVADLFRVERDRIVEHWNTTARVGR